MSSADRNVAATAIGSTAVPEGETTASPPARVFGRRFREQRLLHQGATITTLLGVDDQTAQPVAIKTVPQEQIPAAMQMRLEHEAEILQRIEEDCLAPLIAVGREHGTFYLVRPFQPGMPLDAVLRRHPLPLAEVLRLGQGMFTALSAAHRQGVLHRGVKPANLILRGADPWERAVLVDFGFAPGLHWQAERGTELLDRVRYLAPEQAGLLDFGIFEGSDLYSAGVVLFASLAGRPPFEGCSVHEILRQHMTLPPPELRSLGLAIPRALDEVLQRLLHKDPRSRYQTAEAVLADLDAISRGIERGEREPALVVGLSDARTTLTEPAFVGRREELQRLDQQLQLAREGQASLVFVEGESGGGKSRLLSEWALRAGGEELWLLRGQTEDQVAQRPFQILEGIAEDIVAAAETPGLAGRLRTRLGDSCTAVGAALPQLSQVFAAEPSHRAGPEAFGEARSLVALSELLSALGQVGRTAVVVLDDCQWADELTFKLLQRWSQSIRSGGASKCRLLLLAAFRSEEVGADHPLRRLEPALHLQLPPFQGDDLRQLAESMAGTLPSEALEVIQQLARGSPFMASAVLRGMVESKALVTEGGAWRVDQRALGDLHPSRQAGALLARRIDLLPLVAVNLLTAAAVLGKEFDLELATRLSGLLSRHAMVGLRQAQRRHLVWSRSGQETWSFVHDRVREAFLSRLSDAERQDLQRQAAVQLESLSPPPVYQLAYLFDAVGDSQRALPYALAAAEQARGQHALEIAEQQYRIASRAAATAPAATRYQIASGLGEVLMLRGKYEPAAQIFEAAKFVARELEAGDLARAQIEGRLGELAFKRGDMKTAASALERGLEHLGRWTPAEGRSVLLPLIREIAVQIAHSLCPWLLVGRRGLDHPCREVDLLAVRLYFRLGHAYWFTRGKIPTLWLAMLVMNLAERYPPTLELAQTYSGHAPVMSLIPWFRRAEKYALRSLQIRRAAGDVWGQAQSLHYYGIVLYAASRFRECIENCREAVRLFQRTGDYWETNMARYQIAASLYRLGELPAAVAEARQLHASGVELGDAQAAGISLDVWCWAAGGNVPAEILQAELARPRNDAQATTQVLVAEGVRLLAQDRPEEAVAVLQQAWQVVRTSGVINAWVAPVLPWLATALRRQAEGLQQRTPLVRRRLLERAERVARQAVRITVKFRNDLPHAFRERALLAAQQGRLKRARRWFDSSLREATQQDARYEYALSLLSRGQVGREVGWPRADQDVRQAQLAIAGLRVGVTPEERDESDAALAVPALSLIDRFDTVLEAGRRIASALSPEAIFHEVRDSALQLLRGEQCQIILAAPDAPPASPQALQALAQRALREQRTLVFSDGAETEPDESFLALQVRSALFTPISSRGRAVACLATTHRHLSSLCGADEQRLADFIATIAGAALENAEGFAELQQLNASLEQRVSERTADLEERTADLARSNAELEQFAYVASHDLREPLRTVVSYCRLLQQRHATTLTAEAHEYVAQAVQAAQRMRDLIDDLLAYSRVGTRGMPLVPTDCNQVLDLAISNLQFAITETGCQITRDPLPVVQGDATQLTRLFQNLLDNAIKFRGDRPPRIHVGVQAEDKLWRFSVADNGIGMSPEHFGRIFMLFQRLHTRGEYPGTGIGLAVCRKTVERHGGQIWVESQRGQGTVFFFTLPLCDTV